MELTFDSLPKKYKSIIDNFDNFLIKNIYSQFGFEYLPFNEKIDNYNDQLKKLLLNFLKNHKIMVYVFSDQFDKEEYTIETAILTNFVICVEGKCIIIEKIDFSLISSILHEARIIQIDVSHSKYKNLREEISLIWAKFPEKIKNDDFIQNSYKPILGFLIRRFYYPTHYFKNPEFFNFKDHNNQNNFVNLFSTWFKSKSCVEMQNDDLEQFFKNNDDEKPNFSYFSKSEFIILRTIHTKKDSTIYYLVIHIETLYLFLMKKFSKKKLNKRETDFCENYSNQYLNKFYGFLKKGNEIKGLIYEYLCNDSLFNFIETKNDKLFCLMSVKRIFCAIKYLQSKSLIHRDLKPDNILVDHDYKVYIADFETIRPINCQSDDDDDNCKNDVELHDKNNSDDNCENDCDDNCENDGDDNCENDGDDNCENDGDDNCENDVESHDKNNFTMDVGSLIYSSPEQYSGKSISLPTDIYSFGKIIYFIYTKKDLENKNAKQIKLSNAPPTIQLIMNSCIKKDPNKRIDAQEISNTLISDIVSFDDFKQISITDHINEISQYVHENINVLIQNNCESIIEYFYKCYIFILNELEKIDEKKSFVLNNFGNLYMIGKGVPLDYEKANEYYEASQKLNNSYAINSIGNFYKKGFLFKQDYSKAREYYLKASQMNNPESFYNLGYLYFNGYGVEQNSETAYNYLIKASELNNSQSFRVLAFLHLYGEGIEQNSEKVMKYYEQSIKLNNNDSIVSLAFIYYYGDSVPKDYYKAIKLFELAASKNVANAFYNLGKMMKRGHGFTKDYIQAKKKFEEAAKLHQPDALYYLGKLYYKGQGVAQNYKIAKSYYEIAAEQNEPYSSFKLGYMYENGIGVQQNISIAEKYYIKAAENHYCSGLFRLGTHFINGELSPIDTKKAIEYFTGCTKTNGEKYFIELNEYYNIKHNLDYYPAHNELGLIYATSKNYLNLDLAENYLKIAGHNDYSFEQNNYGLFNLIYLKNIDEAIYMFEKASNQGFCLAEYNLGYIYEVEKSDMKNAIKYYEKASEHEENNLMFRGVKRNDKRLYLSTIFIITFVDLKLIQYYLNISIEKVQTFFQKVLSKVKKYSDNDYFKFHKENIFHLIKIMISDFFNSNGFVNKKMKTNKSNNKRIKIDKYFHLVAEKQDLCIKNVFEENPEKLINFIKRDQVKLNEFKQKINEIINQMKFILYNPPYEILFGRIPINIIYKNEITTPSNFKVDLNNDFYEGFGIE